MHAGTVLYPLDVDHAGSPIGRRVSGNVVVAVGNKVRPRGRAQAGILDWLRLNWRMVKGRTAALEKRADVVGQPKRGEDRAHRPGQAPRYVALGNHDGNLFGDASFSQGSENVLHHLRLPV